MIQWYASVNYGLERIVGDRIKAFGASDIEVLDSALVFSCDDEINVKCINNLFIVLASFNSGSVNDAAKRVGSLAFRFPRLDGKSFRLVVMDCGKLRAIPQGVMVEAEKNISRRAKLEVHRANPDIEIWLNRRNDGLTFFMVRVRKHSPFDKSLKQGELRPDIVDVMLHMASPIQGYVVVDMFGGWGAIAAAVVDSGLYGKVYTGDINEKCVEFQKARFNGIRDCVVHKWDAFKLPLGDMSVDTVITDPPWGEYEKIDVSRFYDGFVQEASRILRPGGRLVFLSSMQKEASAALGGYGFTFEHFPLKISGKDAFLFYSRRL